MSRATPGGLGLAHAPCDSWGSVASETADYISRWLRCQVVWMDAPPRPGGGLVLSSRIGGMIGLGLSPSPLAWPACLPHRPPVPPWLSMGGGGLARRVPCCAAAVPGLRGFLPGEGGCVHPHFAELCSFWCSAGIEDEPNDYDQQNINDQRNINDQQSPYIRTRSGGLRLGIPQRSEQD